MSENELIKLVNQDFIISKRNTQLNNFSLTETEEYHLTDKRTNINYNINIYYDFIPESNVDYNIGVSENVNIPYDENLIKTKIDIITFNKFIKDNRLKEIFKKYLFLYKIKNI